MYDYELNLIYKEARILARFDVSDTKALTKAVEKYLDALAGKLICALQLWYEGLDGHGVPTPEEMLAIETALSKAPGWADAGIVRYEKFGAQKSYKRI